MSAGLAASTVTPGSTAPVVSLTTPATAPVDADCADTCDDARLSPTASTAETIFGARMTSLLQETWMFRPGSRPTERRGYDAADHYCAPADAQAGSPRNPRVDLSPGRCCRVLS